jgi:hypothetical protein
MAVEDNKESCNYCRFFVDNDRMGVCNRYPESINKHMANWCGEFQASSRKPKERIQIIPSVQPEKPKTQYDIATDTVIAYDPLEAKGILLSMVETITAEPTEEPVKKPGRPKKVVK